MQCDLEALSMSEEAKKFDPTKDPFRPSLLGFLVDLEHPGNWWTPDLVWMVCVADDGHTIILAREDDQAEGMKVPVIAALNGYSPVLCVENGLCHAEVVGVLKAATFPVPATERGLTDIVREQREENARLRAEGDELRREAERKTCSIARLQAWIAYASRNVYRLAAEIYREECDRIDLCLKSRELLTLAAELSNVQVDDDHHDATQCPCCNPQASANQ
jgi:hypothetical protein